MIEDARFIAGPKSSNDSLIYIPKWVNAAMAKF
jgi:hypothetical protein